MQWKRTRITLNIWQDGDFKITENPEEPAERRFRLDCFAEPDSGPEYFGSVKQAQAAAALRNELELVRADNQRLRVELDERRQAEAFERSARRPIPTDDGRGITPKAAPVVIEDPLAGLIAQHAKADAEAEFNTLLAQQQDEDGPDEGYQDAIAEFNGKPRLAFTEAGLNDRPF